MERDLMPGGSSFRDEGKIFVVVAGGDYKEGRLYPGTVQRGQNVRRRLAGPSSKVRQTHFSGIGSGSGDVSTEDAEAGETKLSSGTGVRSLSRQPTGGSAPQNIPSPNPAAAPTESSKRLHNNL